MFGLSKEEQKEKKTAETIEKANDVEERKLLFDIETAQQIAESEKTEIEAIWDDEYKMQIGKQWDTTLAPRSREAKKRRPNSQDNFIFPAIYNMHASLTANEPQSIIEPVEPGDKELADKLTGVIAFERYRNKFRTLWKKAVLQGLMYGPFIYQITWDNTWIGGAGPNRWIGEIRHTVIKKEDFFPDPAIRDLEERLQDCSYINIRYRKKMDFFKENFPDKALFVNADEETAEDEGMDPNQATMYSHWHRGLPKYMPDKWAKEFKTKAEEYRANGNTYKAQEYEDKAKGIYKGVHVAFATKTVMLDYIPYIYDDGLYPIAYRVLYQDEKSPFGLGEIRNVMMPQINHNKADEVELEAMSKEGLGGGYFEKGSMTPSQLDSLMQNSGKGGTWHEVTTLGGLRERTGVKVPASITNYKEHKERMIQTITQNTAIQQGLKPGGVTAYSAIAELGARSDTKNKGKIETMEDLLIDITMMEISRISQFYTEERTFRILGDKAELIKKKAELAQQGIQQAADPTGMMQPMQVPQQIPQQAQQPMPMQQQDSLQQTFSNQEMIKTWEREPGQVEEYIPEFDIRVKVVDERPTDRNYYTNIAMQLVGKFMDVESFWTTIEDGKFPPKEEIMARIKQEQAQQQAIQQQQMMQQQNMARVQMDQQTQLKQQEMALKQQDMQSRQQQQANELPPEFKGIDSVMNQIGLSDEEKQTVLQGIANMEPKLRYQFLNEDPQVQAETIMKLLGSGK